MKRSLTTMMAASRGMIWKLLVVLLVMAAVQIGWMHHTLIQLAARAVQEQMGVTFSFVLDSAGIYKISIFALVVLSAFCALQGCRFSGKNLYTLQRLPLGEWRTTVSWAVVHLSCYLIWWAAQLITVLVLWRQFAVQLGSKTPEMELFVAFYDNAFLHGLLPMAEWSRWIAAIVYLLALAWSSACFGFFQRRGRIRIEGMIMWVLRVMLMSNCGSTGADVAVIVVSLCLMLTQGYGIWEVYHNGAD